MSRAEARRRALDLLREVGIPAAERRIDGYPHEFSGGMRQRVVLALALCAEPELVIADEPTTALDVSVQAQIIALIRRLCRERGTAVMLITHDMGVIAETADRVAVMYAGRIAEIGPVRSVVQAPLHPYAVGLMGAIPTLAGGGDRLAQIPGSMPRLSAVPPGCAFNTRCQHVFARCVVHRPALLRRGEHRSPASSGTAATRPASTTCACFLDDQRRRRVPAEPALAAVPDASPERRREAGRPARRSSSGRTGCGAFSTSRGPGSSASLAREGRQLLRPSTA